MCRFFRWVDVFWCTAYRSLVIGLKIKQICLTDTTALLSKREFFDYFITVTIIKQIAINTPTIPIAYMKEFNLFPKFSTVSSLPIFNN